MKTNILFTALALSLAATTARADFALSTGYDYSTGKYGYTEPTKISTWHATAEYTYEAWSARLYVPHERITTPVGTVIIAGRPRLTARLNARNQGKTETTSGLGDIETSVSFDAAHGSENWGAVFTGTVKFATADEEKGLGTGKRDFALGLNLSRSFGRLTPSIGFGYRIVGKPDNSDLQNYAYGSVGLGWWATDTTNLSLSFDSYQPSSKSGSGVDNEISLGLNQHLGKHWDIEVHALAGLSTYAPDYGVGASLSFSF